MEGPSIGRINLVDAPMAAAHATLAADGGIEGISRLSEYSLPGNVMDVVDE